MNTRKSRLVLAVAATLATALAGNAHAAPFTSPNEDTARGNLRDDYEANTNILSAQLNWKF